MLLGSALQAVSRLVAQPRSLLSYADRTVTLHPAERQLVRPAMFLDGELDKVVSTTRMSSMAQEMRRALEVHVEHAATVAYHLSDVQIIGGDLYKGSARYALRGRKRTFKNESGGYAGEVLAADRRVFLATEQEDIRDEMALAATLIGSVYFGHWLQDDMPLHLAAETLGRPFTSIQPPYRHEPRYRELLNTTSTRLDNVRCRSTWILVDFSQNAFKAARFRTLRSRLSRHVKDGHKLVYLDRLDGEPTRHPANSSALKAALVSRGFGIVDPTALDAEQIAQAIGGARVVVSVEGSHTAHALFSMADDATLVLLFPPLYFNNIFKGITDGLGMHYAFLVGDRQANGYTIDIDRLGRLLDLVGQ